MREGIQHFEIETRQGKDAIFEATCLDDIPSALQELNPLRILVVVSTTLDKKTSLIKNLEERHLNRYVTRKVGVGSHTPYSDVIDIAHGVQNNDIQGVICIGSGSYSNVCKAALMLPSKLPPGFTPDDVEGLVDHRNAASQNQTT